MLIPRYQMPEPIRHELEALNLRLAAIEPPGWQEVFGAEANAETETATTADDGPAAADQAEREATPVVIEHPTAYGWGADL